MHDNADFSGCGGAENEEGGDACRVVLVVVLTLCLLVFSTLFAAWDVLAGGSNRNKGGGEGSTGKEGVILGDSAAVSTETSASTEATAKKKASGAYGGSHPVLASVAVNGGSVGWERSTQISRPPPLLSAGTETVGPMIPTVLLVGAQKADTTALAGWIFRSLGECGPDVSSSDKTALKEVHFFDASQNEDAAKGGRGPLLYAGHMEPVARKLSLCNHMACMYWENKNRMSLGKQWWDIIVREKVMSFGTYAKSKTLRYIGGPVEGPCHLPRCFNLYAESLEHWMALFEQVPIDIKRRIAKFPAVVQKEENLESGGNEGDITHKKIKVSPCKVLLPPCLVQDKLAKAFEPYNETLQSDTVLSGRSATSVLAIQHGNPVWSNSVLSGRSEISVYSPRPAAPLRSDSMESSILGFGSGTNLDIMGVRAQSPAIEDEEEFDASVTEMALPDITSSPRPPAGAQLDRPPKPPQAQGAKASPALARPLPVKPVIMRRASCNAYEGEGIEVSELCCNTSSSGTGPEVAVTVEDARMNGSTISSAMRKVSTGANVVAVDDEGVDRNDKLLPQRENEEQDAVTGYGDSDSANGDGSINLFCLNADGSVELTAGGSYDDGSEYNSGDECLGSYSDGDDDASWDLKQDPNGPVPQQDSWSVLKDEYAVGYGAGGALPFLILGTSSDDVMSQPHVLSPPLMESLQCFFPDAVLEDNFWMKFSMVRDGASLRTMLQNVRGTQHTIIAIETVEGEVFGSFTSALWRKNCDYFGNGESFLWRLRKNRHSAKCHSVIDQAQLESELDVYPWTGENNFVQLCTHDKIAVGGGSERETDGGGIGSLIIPNFPASPASIISASSSVERMSSWEEKEDVAFGFGIAIDSDLLHGTSNPCRTFSSPGLSQLHGDGSTFKILNLEVWALTPCISVEEAEKMELGRLLLESRSLRSADMQGRNAVLPNKSF